ncbi:MAG: sn-glycerol-3-phosphate ABC transporter ATP-binding protein UgpC [Rhizobiales bacterium]|nr:sn-glycerol-3-phosphate ABC transporter ATP-binding protein UgpC [Hyphomicrobiales bacterium]
MAKIKLDDLYKSYGKTEILHGISMEVEDGELIVIVGPSGCGKSTLLRMVAGLETVTAGEISIGDRVVNDLEPSERDIAMVFQNYALYPHMSVFDNMAYGLKIRKIPKEEIKQRVAKAATMLQLEDYLERQPRQLSGGQRQRVAMGRAIVREPAAFLFDEPLSNLDAKLRVQMRMDIKQLQSSLGVTALYVTHDQVEAMTMADRMIVMHDGVAEQIGTPDEIYKKPATMFVAGFIGSPPMNFMEMTNEVLAFLEELKTVAPKNAKTLGIRPEHLKNTSAQQPTLRGTIRFEERLGAETLSHIDLTDGTRVILRSDAEAQIPDVGTAIAVSAAVKHLHYYDWENNRIDV